jgi:hypothetical protein
VSSTHPIPRPNLAVWTRFKAAEVPHLSDVCDEILGSSPPTPAPPFGPDHGRHLLKGLGREDCPHLLVAGLLPTNAWDGPDLSKEARTVRVYGEVPPIEPLDSPVAPQGRPLTFGVRDEAPQWASHVMQMRERGGLTAHMADS